MCAETCCNKQLISQFLVLPLKTEIIKHRGRDEKGGVADGVFVVFHQGFSRAPHRYSVDATNELLVVPGANVGVSLSYQRDTCRRKYNKLERTGRDHHNQGTQFVTNL